jgi:Spy/CpxP family protein refolding chaperone
MKIFKSLFLLCAMLLAGAMGCQTDDVSLDPNADLQALETDAFAVVDAEDAMAKVEDATIENPMVMNPVFERDGRFSRHPRHPLHPGCHLKKILRQLDITREQMSQIREFLKNHRQAIKEALEGLRAANAEIIADANAKRQAILESLRNGEITREEAKQQLRALSQETREAIRNNPANEPFLQAICDSKLALFDNIRSVLNDSQQAEWDEWVAGLEGPCFEG